MLPRKVYFWQNGLCMVFDQSGHQIPELQGPSQDKLQEIIDAGDEQTEWFTGDWHAGTLTKLPSKHLPWNHPGSDPVGDMRRFIIQCEEQYNRRYVNN